MYDTKGLSQDVRFELDYLIYAGIIRKMESVRFSVDAIGINAGIQKEVNSIGELVAWYCATIITSGKYLLEEFQKLQQFIRLKSSR